MTFRRPDELDDDKRIAKDQERLRVPMNMADSSFGFDDVERSVPHEIFDSYGNRPGNRPGPVFANKPALIAVDMSARDAAFDVADALSAAAWRRPGSSAPAAAAGDAYEQYSAELSDAWRQRGPR